MRSRFTLILFVVLFLLGWGQRASAQVVPYTIKNNSSFADADLYVAVVGIVNDAHVWLDCSTGTVKPMSVSDNTITGPTYSGNAGPGNNSKYANCFTKLTNIPNKTINIPAIAGCRIFISVKSQLYFYFFGSTGAPSGYTAPNLSNTTDPNQGIRYEIIELTNGSNGLWTNTTRVDSYQYPMGLEVWGTNGYYKKVGELKTHDQIVAQWKANAPTEFQGCIDANGIIKFPSKIAAFETGGAYVDYLKPYIDAIWNKYASAELVFGVSNEGVWKGRVSGEQFNFTRSTDGATAVITRRPTNLEAMEGSGVMASGARLDLVIQAQICAAINRHAIDLNVASGVQQDFSVENNYYVTPLYNWYCKFWHQADVSYDKLTYAFCYDDVFDKSSTINCSSPTRALITFGGFAGSSVAVTGVSLSPATLSIAKGSTSQLTATVSPSNASNPAVTYSSSNTAVATVSSTGLVTALAAGTANITVTTADGAKTATCAVTVSNSAYAIPGKIEAENYSSMYGIQTEATTDTNAGFNVGWINAGDYMNYSVNVASAGSYKVEFRIASTVATGSLQLKNGSTVLGSATLPNTGGWQSWQTVSFNVSLSAGAQTLQVYAPAGGYNLNWINFSSVSTGCSVVAATGDFSTTVSTDASNLALTFVPVKTGAGATTCILYYSTSANGLFPGYTVSPNTPFRITAAAGSTVYFYYTYSLASGGENNTSANKNSFTVGNCSTLKDAKIADVETTSQKTFVVYPNPLKEDNISLAWEGLGIGGSVRVEVLNLSGAIVKEQFIHSVHAEAVDHINLSQLPNGTYIIKAYTGTEVLTKKIIINR